MKVIICPGIHETQLTDNFLNSIFRFEQQILLDKNTELLVFPTEEYQAYSPVDVYQWLIPSTIDELLFICFSAGVVGGFGAATALQLQGVTIKAFVAIDGWGVPLLADFPIYRLSHDYFTHWSSAFLGAGNNNFYCEPPVAHLTLWQSPEVCQGWIVKTGKNRQEIKIKSSAKDYLQHILLENISQV